MAGLPGRSLVFLGDPQQDLAWPLRTRQLPPGVPFSGHDRVGDLVRDQLGLVGAAEHAEDLQLQRAGGPTVV